MSMLMAPVLHREASHRKRLLADDEVGSCEQRYGVHEPRGQVLTLKARPGNILNGQLAFDFGRVV
jgi:hypothetical protein